MLAAVITTIRAARKPCLFPGGTILRIGEAILGAIPGISGEWATFGLDPAAAALALLRVAEVKADQADVDCWATCILAHLFSPASSLRTSVTTQRANTPALL